MHPVGNVSIYNIRWPFSDFLAGKCRGLLSIMQCTLHVVPMWCNTAPSTVWSLCGYVNISCSQASSSQVPQVVAKGKVDQTTEYRGYIRSPPSKTKNVTRCSDSRSAKAWKQGTWHNTLQYIFLWSLLNKMSVSWSSSNQSMNHFLYLYAYVHAHKVLSNEV